MLFTYFALCNCCEYALLRIFFKKGFFFNYTFNVSLNQYDGEIGSFYKRSTSQITELIISLFNKYFSKFYWKCVGLYYLDSKYDFLGGAPTSICHFFQSASHPSHTIFQEPYIMWSLFLVHMCKMMISRGYIFIGLKFWFFELL